jgi:hypothetical protein
MGLQDVISKHEGLVNSIGQAALNSLFPNDFEFYLVALELLTSDNKTVDYFAFPVSPNSISQIEPQLTNIKKTAGGIVSLITPTFVPKTISIKGNFGRKFRILLKNNVSIDFSAFKFSGVTTKEKISNIFSSLKQAVFDPSIKSGYGATKYLQAIADKSTAVDDNGNSFKLFFYNPILGNNYLVEVIDFEMSMSMESNRIPNYTLQLKAIAPLEAISNFNSNSMTKILTSNILSKGVNQLAVNIRRGMK